MPPTSHFCLCSLTFSTNGKNIAFHFCLSDRLIKNDKYIRQINKHGCFVHIWFPVIGIKLVCYLPKILWDLFLVHMFFIDSSTPINLVAQFALIVIYSHFLFNHLMKNNIKFNPLAIP